MILVTEAKSFLSFCFNSVLEMRMNDQRLFFSINFLATVTLSYISLLIGD